MYEYIGISLGAHPILHISRIKVNKHIIEVTVRQVGYLPELYEEARSEKYKILLFRHICQVIYDLKSIRMRSRMAQSWLLLKLGVKRIPYTTERLSHYISISTWPYLKSVLSYTAATDALLFLHNSRGTDNLRSKQHYVL
jgi:hypothetical protein